MCGRSTCDCEGRTNRGSSTCEPIPTQILVGEGTNPFSQRLRVDEKGRVFYHEVRLPFFVVRGTFHFRVKETWLRQKYGDQVIVTLDDLAQLLKSIDGEVTL